jgi:predicted lipoprotein
MKRAIRYIIFLAVVAIVAYNSVYFKALDEVKAGATSFNASKYADEFWKTRLIPALSNSVNYNKLLPLLQTEKDKAFDQYSHALGIGNIRYFLVKSDGIVTAVDENEVIVQLDSAGRKSEVRIATEYVFGNAVRDASGTLDINEFENSMDFNNVSAEINKIIRERVIPPFKSKVKKGDRVSFHGAIELNREHLNLKRVEVIPVEVSIKN